VIVEVVTVSRNLSVRFFPVLVVVLSRTEMRTERARHRTDG
jgi:hypothetical protein